MSDAVASASEGPADHAALAPPITDWLLRPITALPIAPRWACTILGLLYLLASQLLRAWLEPNTSPIVRLFDDSLNAIIIGGTPLALLFLRGRILKDLDELQPVLRCTRAELETLANELTDPSLRLLGWCVAGSLLFFGLMPLVDPQFFSSAARPQLGDPLLTFFIVRNMLTGWVAGHAIAGEAQVTMGYARLGARDIQVDLLDTRPLQVFSRRGMRSALTWIGAISLVSMFWLSEAAGSANGFIIVLIIVYVVFSFFYTLRGVRGSIQTEKRQQLERLRSEIRLERDKLFDGADAGPPQDSARLASLLAYHDLVERCSDWPFDTPAVLRLALVVFVGLGSWLGGALVERMLETFGF